MFAGVASRGRGAGRAFGAPEVGVPWSEGSVREPGGKRAWTWLTVRFGEKANPVVFTLHSFHSVAKAVTSS